MSDGMERRASRDLLEELHDDVDAALLTKDAPGELVLDQTKFLHVDVGGHLSREQNSFRRRVKCSHSDELMHKKESC